MSPKTKRRISTLLFWPAVIVCFAINPFLGIAAAIFNIVTDRWAYYKWEATTLHRVDDKTVLEGTCRDARRPR